MRGMKLGAGAVLIAITLGCMATHSSASTLVWAQFDDKGKSARIMAADGTGADIRKLTHPDNGSYDIDAAISPDGSQVAFERDEFETGISDIGLVDADGSDEQILDLGCVDPCVADLTPSWLPGGERFAFTRVVGPFDGPDGAASSAVLQTVTTEGADIERFSPPGIDGVFEDYHPRFSPDDSYFVFLRVRNDPFDFAVFRADADFSNIRRLTPWNLNADLPDLSLATSGPTEDLVVFETYGHGAPKGETQNVGTVPTTCPSVSECRDEIEFLTHKKHGPGAAFNPAWSPAGDQIAYVQFREGSRERPPVGDIWAMNPDGSGKQAIIDTPRFDYRPDWGPDAP
jgi:Tol biopolymer transport system component